MEGEAEPGVDCVRLPVIATVARLLCRELTLETEYLRLGNRTLRSKNRGRLRSTDEELQYDPRYTALLNLPKSRCAAWTGMRKHREKAARTGSAKGAADVFQRAFGLSPDELHELYLREYWRGPLYGGNRRTPISQRVKELVEMADAAEGACTAAMIEDILSMRYNTGKVGEKLQELSTSR